MANVDTVKEFNVSADALFKAITDFEKYPEFMPEVVSAKILPGATDKKAQVKFEIEVMKKFEYTLEFSIKKNEVTWKLVESNFFKKNEGRWNLSPNGKGVQVHYELEVSFGFLVPGWITKKLTEVNLPQMFDKFEAQAKKYG